MTKVWVLMGNDYPDAVFSSEAAAEAARETRDKADPNYGVKYAGRRIYWRCYEFELDKL